MKLEDLFIKVIQPEYTASARITESRVLLVEHIGIEPMTS